MHLDRHAAGLWHSRDCASRGPVCLTARSNQSWPRLTEPHLDGPVAATEPPAYFRRLLAQRTLFGQLAEAQRSHNPQSAPINDLDAVVTLLTEELQANFPDLWTPLEPELLVTELGLLHDPHEGPMLGCSICHPPQHNKPQSRRAPAHSRAPRRRPAPAAEKVA